MQYKPDMTGHTSKKTIKSNYYYFFFFLSFVCVFVVLFLFTLVALQYKQAGCDK